MPPPRRPNWKWAIEKRILPKGSAEPGNYNPYRTPWVIGLGDAASRPITRSLSAVLCRQMSKTEFLLNDMGHTLDEDPRPLLYVGPTEKNVKSISTSRVLPMIESTPSLDRNHLKGQHDKTGEKNVNGVRLGFAWAGSATEIASHPAAKVYIDERDRMKPIAEGDVDSILQEAVATYAGQIFRVSTPLLGDVVREWDKELSRDHWEVANPDEIDSPIWLAWQEGSRHEWHVPCLHCLEYFAIHLELLEWDDDLPADQVGKTAGVVCPHCAALHKNSDKETLNARGVFIAPDETIEPYPAKTNKKAPPTSAVINGIEVSYGSYLDRGKQHLSFWVSGLCSPWSAWENRAEDLKKAKDSKDTTRIQGVINTQFGQVYKPKGQAPEWEYIKQLQGAYQLRTIPTGVKIITAGVDVHKHRINYVIRGWGVGYESWLIDYGELWGDCKYLDNISWNNLAELLQDLYDDIPISLMMVDAGYKPNDDEAAPGNVIYQFCYKNKKAVPAIGYDKRTRAFSASTVELTYKGKPVKDGLKIWNLDTDYFKDWIYTRYEWDIEQDGGWHLPADVEDEYLRQVSSEARIILANGKPRWEKIRKDNHYLDCEMMATAGAHILRLHRLKHSDEPAAKQKTRSRSRKVHRSR